MVNMLSVSDAEFDSIISQDMDEMQQDYKYRLNKVLVNYED